MHFLIEILTQELYNCNSSCSEGTGNDQVNYDINPNGAVLYGFVEGIGLKPALDIAFKIAGKEPITDADIQANIQDNPGFEENYSIGQTFAIIPALSGAVSGGAPKVSPAYATSNGSVTVQPATVETTAPVYYSSNSNDENKPQFKKPITGSGKEKATDVPSWAKGNKPYVGENGNNFAKRLLDGKYGSGNYKTGPGTEFNQIKKWGDRAFK